MTGELFALLREHSILGRPAREAAAIASEVPDAGQAQQAERAFARGVSAVRERSKTGASELLFSTRALLLTGQMSAALSLDYLSGLLIGEELRCALAAVPPSAELPLALIGDAALCARYRQAVALWDVTATVQIDGSAPLGLWQIAGAAGVLEIE
jgi:2-dehydro-3-deoxygalactonokinase